MGNSFKINVVNPNWEFIIVANNEKLAVEKLCKYLDKLMKQDGFTIMSLQAKESIDKSDYTIELYIGFVVT